MRAKQNCRDSGYERLTGAQHTSTSRYMAQNQTACNRVSSCQVLRIIDADLTAW